MEEIVTKSEIFQKFTLEDPKIGGDKGPSSYCHAPLPLMVLFHDQIYRNYIRYIICIYDIRMLLGRSLVSEAGEAGF